VIGWDWRALRRVRRDRSECKRRQAANGSAPALRAMCTHRSTTLDEIKTRPTRPAHRPIRSNRRHRLLAAFRKRAGLACELAKFASICNLFRDAESGCNPHPLSRRPRWQERLCGCEISPRRRRHQRPDAMLRRHSLLNFGSVDLEDGSFYGSHGHSLLR
jgi:hypothetical protein